MILTVMVVYLALLILIGAWSARRGADTAEDYFLAGRSFGALVLFMALFGTNVTAFAMIGFPGFAYHHGVGVFGFFGASAAFFSPLCFILIGYPIWAIGKRNGYLTPAQMFGDRWRSPALGTTLFCLLVLYTFLYLSAGIIGGGVAIDSIAGERISYGLAVALVTGVALTYTALGGMRGTAWTNVMQASLFLTFLVVACVGIAHSLGGPTRLFERLAAERPDLLGKEGSKMLTPGNWAVGLLVGPVSVIAFPHLFMRLLAARDARALRTTILLYPFALLLLFIPVTLIGVWGALDFPGLQGKEADQILPLLVDRHLPEVLTAVGLAAILAAVMSSLDGQLLAVSTMVAVDLVGEREGARGRTVGRIAIAFVAAAAWLVAIWRPASIVRISLYAFSGYTLVVPVMVAGFFWRRSTATGVVTATLASHALLALYYLHQWLPDVAPKLPSFGLFPVATCLAVEVILLVAVSLATTPPPIEAVDRFADPFGEPPTPELPEHEPAGATNSDRERRSP